MLSISALPLTSRMPGIVTVSLLALPSVVLPSTVRFPMTPAFPSTSNVSMCAVPSRNRSLHSIVDVPKSLVLSGVGIK